MIERTYRVVRGHPGFEVEIRRLGALVQIAAGFPSEAAPVLLDPGIRGLISDATSS